MLGLRGLGFQADIERRQLGPRGTSHVYTVKGLPGLGRLHGSGPFAYGSFEEIGSLQYEPNYSIIPF